MKNVLILFLPLLLAACHKEKVDPVVVTPSSATDTFIWPAPPVVVAHPFRTDMFIGSSASHSQTPEEIWTSPNDSHFEVRYDSFFVHPDTLIIQQIAKDSFTLKGRAAAHLTFGPFKFNYKEGVSDGGHTVYSRNYSVNGYNTYIVSLTIDADGKTATLGQTTADYYYNRPSSSSNLLFKGGK